MKCLLVLALLCAAAYGQMCNGGMRGIHGMRGNHGIGGMRGSGGMSLMSMVGCMCIGMTHVVSLLLMVLPLVSLRTVHCYCTTCIELR